MKHKLCFIGWLMLATTTVILNAQTSIILQSKENATMFNKFSDALTDAKQGDIIYLSGGSFNIGNVIIDKKLTIIGAGHYPSHTQATGLTFLSGNITLITGADTTMLQGFYLSGDVRLGSTAQNQRVNHVNLIRCNVNSIWLSHNSQASSDNSLSQFINIQENVIRGDLGGGFVQQIAISKNIIDGGVYNFNGGVVFSNNIFLRHPNPWSPLILNIRSGLFRNNIFISPGSYMDGDNSGSGFYNNLFSGAFTIPAGLHGSGNIVSKPRADIFVQQTGNVFSYDHNYRLKPESGGIGTGNDGFDIGIYGTPVPFKDGAVPYTPHTTTQSISSESDASGKINININVKAQER